ncbi:MAG: phenylalanine--tRNA ligase subunit beta [Acidobacteriaceae bacterium]|jgi:phenylalanyl-tRNA synthetase beta chain|nr:phenylalanine--tRNA ligase subunit beta [Acidobacteriaceae bacterium]
MKLLLSWVRDFVDVTAPAGEIAGKLALRGFEVASIETLGDDDAVIDFEVTANRPDCLSVLGFARELGTLYDLPVRSLGASDRTRTLDTTVGSNDSIRVTVEDTELCPRYAAAVADITNVPTPPWMVERLHAAGVRPISISVDITNYVLMELGQPMHAFDINCLDGGEIRVRRARHGETIDTLDAVTRTLDSDMLVIADAKTPQAVAGVMGGARSEVSSSTKRIVFESATFKPASVRRTSKKLNLKTEASSRFERGADVNAPVLGLQRALALLQQAGAGHAHGKIVDCYPHPRTPQTLLLRRSRLARLLGLTVPDLDVVRILEGLGFGVAVTSDGWMATVPTFRVDVSREVDLIEEVGRHYGFDRLEAAFPPMATATAPPDPRTARDQRVRHVLLASGLSEAVTFGFIEEAAAAPFAASSEGASLVAVANPLSAKFDTLRPSLLPGLLGAVAHNRRHGRREVALFEIGARFTPEAGETRGVAIAWTGAANSEHWSAPPREVDFFDLKGVVGALADALDRTVHIEATERAFLVRGRSARIVAHGVEHGVLGQIVPPLAERAGAPAHDAVYVAELNLDSIAALVPERRDAIDALPRYPSVVRDLSIIVPDALPAEIIRDTIQSAADTPVAPLAAIAFFDRYKGKGVPDGSISLSVRLTFQAADRTLTDADVQTAFERILLALVREHGAVQR